MSSKYYFPIFIIVLFILIFFYQLSLNRSNRNNDFNKLQINNLTLNNKDVKFAFFAGGCFWCVESDFEKLNGVLEVISGFSGGTKKNPSYYEVSRGKTNHTESVKVIYDSSVISYDVLLNYFWHIIDPTDSKGQFVDRGRQYRPVIFYNNKLERDEAMKSKKSLEKTGVFKKSISVEITPFKAFYPAEDYHQNYYKKNPLRYKLYRRGSGRDQFLKSTWENNFNFNDKIKSKENRRSFQKPSREELKKKLSPLQFSVTQESKTETPFNNKYWNNTREGIYVDVVSGEPLFSSKDKFDSGTGWPSFTKPLINDYVVEKSDHKLLFKRTEIRSKYGDSHLGHLFNDGPAPTGLRYCMNSAALRFITKENLKKEGYFEFENLFK